MKVALLFVLFSGIFNTGFSQVKSVRQVEYSLGKESGTPDFFDNTSRDSCVVFWEKYDSTGKILIKYDFPADRCWQVNGPWEHHYFYDDQGRIVEHQYYGGEEGEKRILMKDFFYSYPFQSQSNKALQVQLIYNYQAETVSEQEQIDTIFREIVNTDKMYFPGKSYWKFDTIHFRKGDFIFKQGFKYDKNLFREALVEHLTGKQNIEDFEKVLVRNIKTLSENLVRISEANSTHFCEFEFLESDRSKSLHFKVLKYYIYLSCTLYNSKGENYLTMYYEYKIGDDNLKKVSLIKTYTSY
ncbi:MAG TPA: hypothetical protein PLO67_20530 [Saprospiraceae bacterium]|nr:hypothetical protein [Saprospiraceae bacterium]